MLKFRTFYERDVEKTRCDERWAAARCGQGLVGSEQALAPVRDYPKFTSRRTAAWNEPTVPVLTVYILR